MAAASLRALTVAARSKHTATIIFVHGLGDSGAGWEFVARQLGSENELHHVKWVLPHAPIQSVTANMGASMPSWYDIYQFGFTDSGGKRKEDEEGMLKSSRQINELISAEIDAGIPASRIVLGGFSQGGVMSLLTGLTNERKLGGIVALSCYIPLKDKFKAMVSDNAKKLPIFWGHGKADPLVVYGACQESIAYLKKDVGIADAKEGETTGLTFKSYEGVPHSVCEEEVEDLGTWLKKILPQI